MVIASSPQGAEAVNWTGAVDSDLNNAGNWDAPVNVNGVLIDFGAAGASNALTVAASFQGGGSGIGNMTITRPAGLSINNLGAVNLVGLRFAGNAGLTINAGTGAVNFGGSNNAYLINMGTGTSTFINNSATTANINSNVQLNATGGTNPIVAFAGTGAWNITGTTSGTVKGLVKNSSADLTLGGNNAHVGETIINTGTLTITNSNALGATGAANDTHIVGANGSTGTTLILSGSALTIGETLNFNASAAGRSGLSHNSAFNHVLNGPIDVSSTGTLVQWSSNGAGSITVNGDITGNMSGGSLLFLRGGSTSTNNRILGSINLTGGNLAKTDDGLWVIGNAGETYSWNDTQMARGTLRLNLANMLPAATNVIVGQGTDASAATLDLFGFSQTIGGLSKQGTGTNKQITNSSGTAATLTVNNTAASTYNGRINGNLALTKLGDGTLTLTDANAFTGTVTVQDGVLNIQNATALGAVNKTVTIAGDASNGRTPELQLQGGLNVAMTTLNTSGNGTAGGGVLRNISGNNTITATTINLTAGNGGSEWQSDAGLLTINGNISANATGRNLTLDGAGNGQINGNIADGSTVGLPVTKNGTGLWTLAGAANTYTGTTLVNTGVLALNNAGTMNNIAGSATVRVANAGTLDVTGLQGGTFDLATGQTLTGGGTILGNVIVDAGSFVSPGNSPGTQFVVGNETWASGGTYIWEIDTTNNAVLNQDALKGVDPGFDFIDIEGALNITATSGNPFIIDVRSLLHPAHTAGAATNFSVLEDYSWTIATAEDGITGFNPAAFSIARGTGFDPFFGPNGSFFVTQVGNSVVLNFHGIPEPTTAVLGMLGAAALLRRGRRQQA